MLKLVLFITLFFYNVLSTLEDVPTKMLPVPVIHRISFYGDDAFELHWYPLESDDEENPILGYKIKIWEMKKYKIYILEDDISVVKYLDIDYSKVQELPDYDPFMYKVVPGKRSSTARIEGTSKAVFYLIRVQAYDPKGDGPYSEALGLGQGNRNRPIISKHLKNKTTTVKSP